MCMYEIMRNVILAQDTPVEELQRRIDTFYAEGKLTEEEKRELEALVFSCQTPDAEKAELGKRVDALTIKLTALEERVERLEGGQPDEIPVWKPWNGVSTDYQPGAIVTHNGKVWLNVLEGMQNVWEPGVSDSRYWQEVK